MPSQTDVAEPSVEQTDPQLGNLKEVPINLIRANPRNPRQTFDPRTIERLAASIEEIGLQVPVTVYPDPERAGGYILLDGERRFRATKLINRPLIPALVVKAPDASENAVRMFNIHMLREDWREIETAWALEQIMEETGKQTDRELQKLTGLSPDRIRNMKRVLSFPKALQEKVARGELPFQMLVELDKNVLSRRRQEQKADESEPVLPLSVPELRDVFLKKFTEGHESDIVDLRHVGTLFDTAKKTGKVAQRARNALQSLIKEPEMTIQEAYEVGAASSVELGKILRDVAALPSRLEDLLESGLDEDQRREVQSAVQELCRKLANIDRAIAQ
jgi:ParB/RepB/Spo0J family partition protein